ncbi:beta-ketoacyl synthase chain length factor [Paraburkholderia rhizosphaerae]|uniref:Beta-ketoacyl synthase-like protein n=1 Tax=Paraburkholderia rhizosphaerae TaxID=480658 RepID=A0A4R8LMC4_9BURK|nr:beta-ketoacyl synthase chain length factor [Paraburkholderia rhizosphaerae]TDY46445.1 beta-ketoacyl synthase-like protein [Paraburkholderia rhizosphaerae]
MTQLHWSLPVARWSSWPVAAAAAPDIGFIEPLVRRRLSSLSRIALKVAHDCAAGRDSVRVLFASRHGELRRTTEILRSINAGEPVSPTSFSLSVLNAMTGVFGIARADRSAAGALSAGAETLGYALLEAYAQYATQPSEPVLLVYADELADPAYGAIEDEVNGGALAILIDGSGAQGRLSCRTSSSGALTGRAADADAIADRNAAGSSADGAPPAVFTTQGEALLHCLDGRTTTQWRRGSVTWEWNWHDSQA